MEWTKDSVLSKLKQQPWFEKFSQGEIGYLPLNFYSFYFALFKDSVGTEFYFLTQPEKHEKEIMETYRFMKVAIPILSDIVEKNYNKQLTGNDF